MKNLYICKGYSARQLISATRAGLWTACARCRCVEATSHRQLVKYLGRTSSRRSLINQLISGKLSRGHAFQREADILNVCCKVLVLHCLSALLATMFYLNVHDNNDGAKLTWCNWHWFTYAVFHTALYRYLSRDTDELHVVFLQIC